MSRVSRTFKLTWRIIKLLFVLLIVFINVFLLWRVFSSSDPKSLRALSPNKALAEAYEAEPSLPLMFRQEQRTITSGNNNSGYFSVTKATFIPEANQIQIVFRYNVSTLRATQEDFGLDAAPDRNGDVYDVSLLVVTDLTPENKDDNLKPPEGAVAEHRILPTYSKKEQTKLYNYELFVFDLGELDLTELLAENNLISVFTDVYYEGALDYDATPYGTLCLYDYITETIDVKLTSADKKALDAWIAQNKK